MGRICAYPAHRTSTRSKKILLCKFYNFSEKSKSTHMSTFNYRLRGLEGPAPTWCTKVRYPLFFRFLCTKSRAIFSPGPAPLWCTNSRYPLFFRFLCTKSRPIFSLEPAPTWCTKTRFHLFFRFLCTKSRIEKRCTEGFNGPPCISSLSFYPILPWPCPPRTGPPFPGRSIPRNCWPSHNPRRRSRPAS